MKVQLNDNFRIETDAYNFIIAERLLNKKKQEWYWKPQCFYGTLDGALSGYIKLRTRTSDVGSISELVGVLKALKEEITAIRSQLDKAYQ